MERADDRTSRYRRAALDKSLAFTARDCDILTTLYKYHLATTHQLVAFHQGNKQKTRWRLRELFDAGLVERFHTKTDFTTPGSEPIVYALTDRGADWLSVHRPDFVRQRARYNERNQRRTPASIPHALMLSEVMLAFELAAYYRPATTGFVSQHDLLAQSPESTRNRKTPTHWNTRVIVKGEHVRIGNNPDQLFGIVDRERPEGRNTLFFFLEADRGTETVRPTSGHLLKSTIYKKQLGYFHTHLQRVQTAVFGEWMRNFRVLWVIDAEGKGRDGRTRLDHFLETTNAVTEGKVADLFLFTTYGSLKASGNPFTHPWVNAKGEERYLIPPIAQS